MGGGCGWSGGRSKEGVRRALIGGTEGGWRKDDGGTERRASR